MSTNIIGVPFKAGCDKNGTQYSPIYFKSQDEYSDIHIIDTSDIPQVCDKENGVNNYRSIIDVNHLVKNSVSKALSNCNPVCVIGGDHSVSLGSISAILEKNKNTGVIWFDAHTDINSEKTSPSGNAHGMPVAALIGECSSELNEIAANKLNPENVFWIGARSIDDGEKEILDKYGIADHVYTVDDVRKKGMREIIREISLVFSKNFVQISHISFDVDGMDKSVISATGTPVANGLTEEDLTDFIAACDCLNVHTMDFVEYNPLLDHNNADGKWCVKTLNKLLYILR